MADSVAQLVPLIAIFAFIFTALLFWCFLSSCLGLPLRRLLSNWWDYTLLGAMSINRGPGARGRAPYAEDELWELQHRNRR